MADYENHWIAEADEYYNQEAEVLICEKCGEEIEIDDMYLEDLRTGEYVCCDHGYEFLDEFFTNLSINERIDFVTKLFADFYGEKAEEVTEEDVEDAEIINDYELEEIVDEMEKHIDKFEFVFEFRRFEGYDYYYDDEED